jgi:hypothetical protein
MDSNSRGVASGGPHATGIGAYTAIFLYSFEDDYSELPDLRSRAWRCDFCRFLRAGLLSDEVRFAITDQSERFELDLKSRSIRIKATLCYSWEPERRNIRRSSIDDSNVIDAYKKVGLEALYVLVSSINPRRTMDRCNPIVPDGVICELRYNIIDDPGKAYFNNIRINC